MKTKIQLVSMALDELRINGITSNADSEDEKLALNSLEQLVSELTFDIGWRFEEEPDPNTVSGIPLFAESAIYMALAVRIAPRYGKDPGMIRTQAAAAMNALMSKVNRPRQISYPSRMPMGLGNRMRYPHSRQFMPPPDAAPDNVNTESFVVGDARLLSVDFTELLLPDELILSYEAESSSGLVIAHDEYTNNVIELSVQATDIGYQNIILKVTGDYGTVVNRHVDISVFASQSIRGIP